MIWNFFHVLKSGSIFKNSFNVTNHINRQKRKILQSYQLTLKSIWRNLIPIYIKALSKLRIEGNFLNSIKNICNNLQLTLYLTVIDHHTQRQRAECFSQGTATQPCASREELQSNALTSLCPSLWVLKQTEGRTVYPSTRSCTAGGQRLWDPSAFVCQDEWRQISLRVNQNSLTGAASTPMHAPLPTQLFSFLSISPLNLLFVWTLSSEHLDISL